MQHQGDTPRNQVQCAFDVRFFSQNVRGINDAFKRKKVFNNFNDKADIIFVQESHSTSKLQAKWDADWTGDIRYSHGTSASCGCMIMFKASVDREIIDTKADENGRYLMVKCLIQGQKMFLVNVYGPNKENEHAMFLNDLTESVKNFYDEDFYHVIFGGDWNFIENLSLDKKGGMQKTWEKSINQMNKLKELYDLVDIWRIRNPDKKQFSWHSNMTPRVFTRLDRFYISDNMQSSIEHASLTPGLCTDHSAIVFHLKCNATILGQGFWKLNTQLLKDAKFIEEINKTIDQVLNLAPENTSNKRIRWDFLKYKVKETAIRESKSRAVKKRADIKLLEKKVTEAEKILISLPDSQAALEMKKQAEKALDSYHIERTRGLIIQSRSQYYEDGEKNSKLFLNLVKSNQEKAMIRSLKINDTETVMDQKEILNELERFYKTLYTSKQPKDATAYIESIKQSDEIPQINEESILKLSEELTKEALAKIVKGCPPNKSPGNDGLPKEFYVVFWTRVSDLLLEALKESIAHGEMSTSQKQSIIRLIPKKDRDKLLIKNWRPLNLINSDTKFYTKWVASKIVPSLNNIIHSNQVAYVKGRFIGEGIKTIEGVINFIRENKLDGYILAIDFEKAFDSIEWEYLWKSMEAFGYPEAYIRLIKVAYNNMEACVINGGTTTRYFRITRGVRQGDPISAYLFIIALELLAIKIRNNKKIKGITIGGVEIKLSAYADDISLFTADFKSAIEIFRELDIYAELTGLRCNKEKTECLRLGKSNMEHERRVEVKWVNYLKITGITFTIEGIDIKKNTEKILEKFESQLSLWKARQISVLGRSQIIKTFGFSQLRFLSNMFVIPLELIKQLKTIAFNFLWNGSERGKVKRRAIVADIKSGGIRFPDLDAILKTQHITWVKRFLYSPAHSWKSIFIWQLDKLGGVHIIRNTSFSPSVIKDDTKLMVFYRQVLSSWFEWNTEDLARHNIKDQQLHYNRYITRPNMQPIFYPDLIKKKVIYVKDIINETNEFVSCDILMQQKQLNVVEYMKYISILKCINNDMKSLLAVDDDLTPSNQKPKIDMLQKMSSKQLYENVLSKTTERPTSETKLSEIFEIDVSHDDWERIYRLPYSPTIETKLRSFQFKVNHNIYYTNEKLHRVAIRESPNCSFCDQHTETLEHLFIACPYVVPLWIFLCQILKESHSLDNIEARDKIFGMFQQIDNTSYDIINHLIITVKYYVHICKYMTKIPEKKGLIEMIRDTERLEKLIAMRKGKLERHQNKWNRFITELDATNT